MSSQWPYFFRSRESIPQAYVDHDSHHVGPPVQGPLVDRYPSTFRSHGALSMDLTVAVGSLYWYRLFGILWRNSLDIGLEFLAPAARLGSVRFGSPRPITSRHSTNLSSAQIWIRKLLLFTPTPIDTVFTTLHRFPLGQAFYMRLYLGQRRRQSVSIKSYYRF